MYEAIKYCLCPNRYIGGARNKQPDIVDIVSNNKDKLLTEYDAYKGLSQAELIEKIIEAEKALILEKREKDVAKKEARDATRALEGALAEKKEPRKAKSIDVFNLLNLYKFFNKFDEGLFYHPDDEKRAKDDDGNYVVDRAQYLYDPFNTAFDKNIDKYREHQQRFIKDWSVSVQELVIMYYSVGSGKTLIAITCAEEYTRLNKNSYVYFLMPSSLILNTILEMYKFGIDPTIEDDAGNKIYNFVSYAQLIRTDFQFRDNSLLIVDEIHNLRNLYTQEINEKISARKYRPTGNYSLLGSVLASKLLDNSSFFIRKIFMTGTLFVNSSTDLEPIIAIGYNKRPLLKLDKDEYIKLQEDDELFKNYYEGLISFYRISGTEKLSMPTVKYHFPLVDYPDLRIDRGEIEKDPYFINTRTLGIDQKVSWIVKFIENHKNQKTLIYTQFLDNALRPLIKVLSIMKIPFATITGELSMEERLEIVGKYNRDEIKILIFTLAIKEGISFKETNNFIVYNPYWNYAILEQVIARGIRLTSHAKGSKSVINVYMLCAVDTNDEHQDQEGTIYTPQDFRTLAEQFMNDDIKTLEYETNEKGEVVLPFRSSFSSRDIDLYIRIFNKQEEINRFERRILALPSFETVNNNENNDFIKIYNQALLDYQQANGKLPSNKNMIELKRKLYRAFYDGKIEETNKNITRFTDDPNYKKNRNPDLLEEANYDVKYPNLENEIRTLIQSKASLDKIFNAFNIDKKTITTFQANFTPMNHIKKLLQLSNITNDKTKLIKILEPTAGIGNVVAGLMELSNKQNYMIDCNELNQVFYQTGKVLYEDLDNVKWYNTDFIDFASKYQYDYVIGNPPFNLKINKMIDDKLKDYTLYDINFVEKAYNMLSDYGTLAFIISSRFQRDQSALFKSFNIYLEEMLKVNTDFVVIEPLETGFETDKKITKEMKTQFGMVYIILKKLPNYYMDLTKPINAIYDIGERMKARAKDSEEYKTVKAIKPKTVKAKKGVEPEQEELEQEPEEPAPKPKAAKPKAAKPKAAAKAAKEAELNDKIQASIRDLDNIAKAKATEAKAAETKAKAAEVKAAEAQAALKERKASMGKQRRDMLEEKIFFDAENAANKAAKAAEETAKAAAKAAAEVEAAKAEEAKAAKAAEAKAVREKALKAKKDNDNKERKYLEERIPLIDYKKMLKEKGPALTIDAIKNDKLYQNERKRLRNIIIMQQSEELDAVDKQKGVKKALKAKQEQEIKDKYNKLLDREDELIINDMYNDYDRIRNNYLTTIDGSLYDIKNRK